MKKILISIVMIGVVAAGAFGATSAYFSDTETSTGNTFTAGSLDLAVGTNNGINTVKFTVTNMKPGDQPTGQYRLNNVGSLPGYLDLESMSVTSEENSCLEPEAEALDTTCSTPNEGELQTVVNTNIYWDNDCDGYWSGGDVGIYNGYTGAVAAQYETNKSLAAGATQCLMVVNDWWSTANDNKAMGDSMTLNMTFELGQTTAQ